MQITTMSTELAHIYSIHNIACFRHLW